MKKFLFGASLLALVCAGPNIVIGSELFSPKPTLTAYTQADFADPIAKTINSVVLIHGENTLGTGFMIGENQFMTNAHVIQKEKPDNGFFIRGRQSPHDYPITVLFSDDRADVAIVSIKQDDYARFLEENGRPKPLYFGDSNALVQGEEVVTIGHPWGLEWSTSKGIISALRRQMANGVPMFYLQTDAHVFQGNSGGIMINSQGQVVGMNSIMVARDGGSFGMAIPSVLLQKFAKDFFSSGALTWPYIGATLNASKSYNGVEVVDVQAGSAAERMGLKKGDVITQVEAVGQTRAVREPADMITLVTTGQPGGSIKLKVLREKIGDVVPLPGVTEVELTGQLMSRPSAAFKPQLEDAPAPDTTPKKKGK